MTQSTETIDKIEEKIDVRLPGKYKVLLHNDDTTTMEFVVFVLMRVFHKDTDTAFELTKIIHETGVGVAGQPYTKEIAEEKTIETIELARANGYPLIASFEEL